MATQSISESASTSVQETSCASTSRGQAVNSVHLSIDNEAVQTNVSQMKIQAKSKGLLLTTPENVEPMPAPKRSRYPELEGPPTNQPSTSIGSGS